MADGKTHEVYQRRGWIMIIPLGGFIFVLMDYNLLYPIFLYYNYIWTDFVDCDIDHPMMTKGEYDAMRKFKSLSFGLLVPEKHKKAKGLLSRFNFGIIGASFVAWSQIYQYFASIFGGHRSWFSHGHIVGTLGRVVWFNSPIALVLWNMISYAIVVWEHPSWSVIGWNYFYMKYWIPPYLTTHFVAWLVGDEIHLLLDTEWAKGRLYGFSKFGDLRNSKIKRVLKMLNIKDEDVDVKKTKKSKSRRRKRRQH